MRIMCLGGGPAGLYFAISMKLRDPTHDIVVVERNRAHDTFGWGVVLSDEALGNLARNDPQSAAAIRASFSYWDDVAVHYRGEANVSGGHGFCGIGRRKMLNILQDRCLELGVKLEFETDIENFERFKDYDLIVASDGVNSRVREAYASVFNPNIEVRACKYLWLGTDQRFNDAFTFIFEKTEHGWIWAHAYQFDSQTATFIVECSEETWRAAGFDRMDQEETVSACEKIFANYLGGHALRTNARHLRGSAWLNFSRVLCERWSHENIVLMGDAAATAHFSIGSGTRLAFDSAIALATYLHSAPTMAEAFARYESERRVDVLRLQSAARNSIEWFEHVERYLDLDPVQFAYSLLTRSQRISHENLRLRDSAWLGGAEAWFAGQAEAQKTGVQKAGAPKSGARAQACAPMFTPFALRKMHLANRIVVSPMAQYRAVEGTPTDWHLVHYGERAKGGAGLVITEMTCVCPEGRITPGCTGLYTSAHQEAWRRIVAFIHAESAAKICIQLGHSGPKGSTQLGWETMDAPLPHGNWPVIAASAIPWSETNQMPRAMTRADMDAVKADFISAAAMADSAGFDMLELHCAHGYLLSSFITPLSNRRTDEYGGTLENRLRYPLEVFAALRALWPAEKPMSVRISANDWMGDAGVTPEEAVAIAQAFQRAGVDIIDVSAGQTTIAARPVYGRMFQTPFSDHIRNRAGVATMAVGNITEADQVNSILMAGRADLCCIGRPHLADPYWTLHAAIGLGYDGALWPKPYEAGRDQAQRLAQRAETGAVKV